MTTEPPDESADEGADHPAPLNRQRVVVITGLAGSGMSTALKMFEDLGYEAVDNLPLAVVPALVGERREQGRALAVAIDSRTRDFSATST